MGYKEKSYHFKVLDENLIEIKQKGWEMVKYSLNDIVYEINLIDLQVSGGKIEREAWENRRFVLEKARDILTYGYARGDAISYPEAREMIAEGYNDRTGKRR